MLLIGIGEIFKSLDYFLAMCQYDSATFNFLKNNIKKSI
jgi:hypothetical protein